MAEQITEKGGQPNVIKRKSTKDTKGKTNKELRRLPVDKGSNISKKDVIRGWEA